MGSTDAGTRVEKSAVLRISVSGVQTPEGQGAINDAKINEEITLAGGEIDLNGNYIDLKGGVVLEPQAQAVWTQNREDGFSETSGSEKNLRL